MARDKRFRDCYKVLKMSYDNDTPITNEKLMEATNWSEATIKTYLSKKLLNQILRPIESKIDTYNVVNLDQFDESSFVRMMSQKQQLNSKPYEIENKNVMLLVDKSRESAFLAIDIYNGSQTKFRSSGFIVMMIIAWTSLLHSYFEGNNIDYFYKDSEGNYKFFDEDKKAWELSKSIENAPFLTFAMKENLKFLIKIRNKIEHRNTPLLDMDLCGHCQSCLLNYEKIITELYNPHYALGNSLVIPLQLSRMNDQSRLDAKKEYQSQNYGVLKNYITAYNDNLSEELILDPEYCFRMFLIPKIGNHIKTSDLAIEFINLNSIGDNEINELTSAITIIKEKQIPVLNPGKYKPSQVVTEVKKRSNIDFTISTHTALWKKHKVRPEKNAENKAVCKIKYCQYDKVHNDYIYTDDWIDFLLTELNK